MADDVANTEPAAKPLDHLANTERTLDAGRPDGGDPSGAGPAQDSPQTAQAVKAEEKSLTNEVQALETDRAEQDKHAEGGSNRPDIEPAANNSGASRLRAFEDEHLGKDAVRLNGLVERGSGSPYQAMSGENKLQYVALERLVIAEQKLADARAAAAQAEADCAAAEAHVEECSKAAEQKPDAAPAE